MHIVALSGGMLNRTQESRLLNDYVLGLCASDRPNICFLPTASGDWPDSIVSFYETFDVDRCQPRHLSLFSRTVTNLRALLLDQDVICVGGGNTANMLAIWRLHGLDEVLREAWQSGVVLCGWSAGGMCWFQTGCTDSFGPQLAAIDNCLGFLPGSFCPHYNSEPLRRPTYPRLVAEGLPAGWALDDGAALHFEGTELRRVLSAREGATAYRVEKMDGEVGETPLVPEELR